MFRKRAILAQLTGIILATAVSVAPAAIASPLLFESEAEQNSTSGVLEASQDVESNNTQERLERYLRYDEDGTAYIDVLEAYIAGESDETLAVAIKYNELFAPSHTLERSWSDPATWFQYGNWCGKGHSGPGAPINAVDEACKHHDECYAAHGFDDCGCDRTLRAEVDRARYAPGVGPDGKIAAEAILFWVSHKQCQWNNL